MKLLTILFLSCFLIPACYGQPEKKNASIAVIAYYSGNDSVIDQYPVDKLTHIIFSFCHLKDNRLAVDDARDSATIRKLVSLKSKNPSLKIMLSLGGWGGCKTCSDVFATEKGRKEFAASVKEVNDFFHTDGIDLDWEYPAISGYPGHTFRPEDRANFTSLVLHLRDALGKKNAISFAAGGSDKFLDNSIEWSKVMPVVDWVNLMSYDLVSGFSTVTGNHTALYATPGQQISADHAIGYLEQLGVPLKKIVIGAAFYARTWENVPDSNHGLYQPGKFKSFIPYRQFDTRLSTANGFVFYQDTIARAGYAYNASTKEFATFEDVLSIGRKTSYAMEKGLYGIMFWELSLDKPIDGLLNTIDEVRKKK
jgi:chitinase